MSSTLKTSKIQALTKLFAVILFGGALFIFSINSLKAESKNTFDFPESLTEADANLIQSSNGKYQMQFQMYKNEKNDPFWCILVWNTQTGQSKFYTKSSQKGTILMHKDWNLPTNPL